MKSFQLNLSSILKLLFLVLLFSRCEDDPNEKEFSGISEACFNAIGKIPATVDGALPSSYKGTIFHFMNCSPTANSAYRWTFGDGNTSEDEHPEHVYDKAGTYKVTLTTYYEGVISDTVSHHVEVVHGQKMFKLAQKTVGIDITESSNGDVLLVGWRSENNEVKYFIAMLDSTLSVRYVKEYPYDQVELLTSIERTSDGNFILSGSQDGHWTALKIDALGNILWQSILEETTGINTYINETSDKGFIAAGTINININGSILEYTEIIKLDSNGEIVWRRSYEEHELEDTNNVIELSDGYAFAAVKSDPQEDTIVLSKVSLEGDLLWRTEMRYYAEGPVGYRAYTGSSLYIGDRYYVYSNGGGPVFVLNQTGTVLTKNIIEPFHIGVAAMAGGNQIVFLSKLHSLSNFDITKIDESFSTVWTRDLGIVYNDLNYYPASSYFTGLNIKELSSGDYVVLGTRADQGNSEYLSVYIIKIREDGRIF